MGTVLNRVAALLCVLAFVQSATLQCAGWQATPEARRQCCREGACPHPHQDQTTSGVTQPEADACCAQAAQRESTPSTTAFAAVTPVVLVRLIPGAGTLPAITRAPAAPWDHASPPPRLARHLLLSVLLV